MINIYFLAFLVGANPWQWPMYGQNLASTHYQTGKGRINVPLIKWSFSTVNEYPAIYGPLMKDINGDDSLEVFFGDNGRFYSLTYDGKLRWSYSAGYTWGGPAVVDINKDGVYEVAFGAYTLSSNNNITVMNQNGSFLWSYKVGTSSTHVPHSSIRVADIDVDTWPELAFSVWHIGLDVLNHNNTLLWNRAATGGGHGAPAVQDIDGDGKYELAFGEAWGGTTFYVLENDNTIKWSYAVNQQVFASPAIADINKDGKYEILFTSNDGTIASTSYGGLGTLWCFSSTGAVKWSNFIDSICEASPAIADLDNDSLYEVVVGNERGVLYVFNSNGTTRWTRQVTARIDRGCAIADLDGDGYCEIVTSNSGNGTLYCFNHDGSICWTISISYGVCEPTIGDIDHDDCLEVAVGEPIKQKVYLIDDPYGAVGCNSGGGIEESRVVSDKFVLKHSGKNLVFSIPYSSRVNLKLYDIAGRCKGKLIDAFFDKGSYNVMVPLLSSGIYFAVLRYDAGTISCKLVVLR